MNNELKTNLSVLTDLISQAGFMPMNEFSAVDSLIYCDKNLGIITIESCDIESETLAHDFSYYGVELNYHIKLRLMGNSCDYVDYDAFSECCDDLIMLILCDKTLIADNIRVGKTFQSMPLKRLERQLSFDLKVFITEVN